MARVPEALRARMEELLRAQFRQVISWKPPAEPEAGKAPEDQPLNQVPVEES